MGNFDVGNNYNMPQASNNMGGYERRKSSNNKKTMIIVIGLVAAVVVGLLVFFITSKVLGNKKQGDEVVVELDINSETVQSLYKYVTYGVKGTRYDKYIKENDVTINSFSNFEKYYYALQFAQANDLTPTGKVDSSNRPIYKMDSSKVKEYMERYFGSGVTYNVGDTFSYPFNFKVNNFNFGTMTYSQADSCYFIVFTSYQGPAQNNNLVQPFYTKLVSAKQIGDDTIELVENVVYTTIAENKGYYTAYVYKDYNHTKSIDQRSNMTKEQILANPINIDDYKDNTSKITYTFKVNSKTDTYYFYSSSISSSLYN